MPLCSSMKDSYKAISKVTKVLKTSFSKVYASYMFTKIMNSVIPRVIPIAMINAVTTQFTLGFSNTPGPIKPVYFQSESGKKMECIWLITYMIVAGNVGLAINCVSFCESFRVAVTADNGVLSEGNTNRLC